MKIWPLLLILSMGIQAQIPAVPLSSFGVVGDGKVDDTASFQKAMDQAHGKRLEGAPGCIYRITGTLVPPQEVDLDLRGAHLRVEGNVPYLFRKTLFAPAGIPLAKAPQPGEADLVLAKEDPSLKPGLLIRVTSTALSGRVPPGYRRIRWVDGVRVHVEAPMGFAYPEPAALVVGTWNGGFKLRNGVLEAGKAQPITHLLWLAGYEEVDLQDLTVQGFQGGESNLFIIQDCVKVRVSQCSLLGNAIKVSGEAINVWDASRVDIDHNTVDGEGFGIAVVRGDHVAITFNHLKGRAATLGRTSTRGIKIIGCHGARIQGNEVADYMSGIKSEDSGATLILDNHCEALAPGEPTSFAIGASNQNPDPLRHGGLIITRNVIVGSGGLGIFLDAGSPGSLVRDNTISKVGTQGIYAAGENVRVENNRIDGFGLIRPEPAIHLRASSTSTNNQVKGGAPSAPTLRLLNPPAPHQ